MPRGVFELEETVERRVAPNGQVFVTRRRHTPPFQPRPNTLESVQRDPEFKGTLQVARPGDPEPYVFGRKLVRPTVIAAATDTEGRLLLDLLISVGEIEEIEYVQIAGENEGKPGAWEFFTGTSGQSASTLMTAAKGSYDTLANKAHFVVRLNPGASLDIQVMVKGLKLTDPRASPQLAYSTNPALALNRVLTDAGFTVDSTSLTTAADYCDETVGGDKRWEIGLHINNRAPVRQWAEVLAQYCGCFLDIQGGTVYLVPDTPRASSHTISETDIVSGSFRLTKSGGRNVPQRVAVHYEEADGTEKTAETATSADPGKTARLRMPGFTSYTMAKRYATSVYNKSQSDLGLEFVTFDSGLSPTLGDVGSITHALYGLTSKEMTLVEYQALERGRWRLRYEEYDAAHFSDQLFTEPTAGDTSLPNPNNPPDGPTPTVAEELYTDQTGTTYSRLKITFTGVDWPYVDGYRVTASGEQNVLETIIAHRGLVTHTVYTAALRQGVTYSVDVYVKSRTGVYSTTPGNATAVALGKLLPPGDVPSLTAYEAGTLVAMSWEAAEEITGDLRGYIIKRLPSADYTGTSADWTHTNAVTLATRVDATTYLTAAQPSGEYYYGIKAVDNAGNFSTNATWRYVNVTASSGSSNAQPLYAGTLTNMHDYIVGGKARYAITSLGETWGARFGNTSPLATWGSAVTASPAERWGGDLQTDSAFESEVWDVGSMKQGNWTFSDQNVTVFGGTQANRIIVGDNSSPISFTTHVGNAIQSAGQHLKFKVFTSDSPASAGDGLHIKQPLDASFSGAVLEQAGTVTIASTSPLDNPKSVTFATAYTTAPDLTIALQGSSAKIIAYDNLTATGFDLYIWTTAGAKTDGTVTWTAKGT